MKRTIFYKKLPLRLWNENKPFFLLVLLFLSITSLLKITFYLYNHAILSGEEAGHPHAFRIIKWALAYDIVTILSINIPFLILLFITQKIKSKLLGIAIKVIFCIANTLMIILNIVDIFYFRFHFQRSNISLFSVTDHPLQKLYGVNVLVILSAVAALAIIVIVIWKIVSFFYTLFHKGHRSTGIVYATIITSIISIYSPAIQKRLVPTYPLSDIDSKELQIVQNSFHTFVYSLYRNKKILLNKKYYSDTFCDSMLPVTKVFAHANSSAPKNIVLFIMESVPKDFFDTAGKYKVQMPFFDSVLQHSTYFSNAYSYGHESNKGITSILSGIPTLTDIPLYHSSFINLPKTTIGKALKSKNYASFFCIGDTYDNFGFAACTNWLGFDKYYSEEDIPDYKQLPAGPMGIHDAYTLDFFHEKIKTQPIPFFAVHFNISTHWPHDLPKDFVKSFPPNYTDAMKSMAYYDSSLHHFFNTSKNERWFSNTIFLFCSDHWGTPDPNDESYNNLSNFKIPIIIYDPSSNIKKTNTILASQFDLLGTILHIGGYSGPAVSYGKNLLDTTHSSMNGMIYNRVNNTLYQIVDINYVLGFNISNDKAEYLYDYTHDIKLKYNLINNNNYTNTQAALTKKIKVFYQKVSSQYINARKERNN